MEMPEHERGQHQFYDPRQSRNAGNLERLSWSINYEGGAIARVPVHVPMTSQSEIW